MQRNTHLSFLKNRPLQRIAALTGLVLAGLTLLTSTAAAQIGPLVTSPNLPTPYITPLFHGGGASTPYPLTSVGTDPLLDPLYGQLQGTASGVYPATVAGAPTQIPSFLLGNYNPLLPPAAGGVYYPNHFADGSLYSWSAPFSYIAQNSGGFTLDDSQTTAIPTVPTGTPGAGSVFTDTPVGNWDATQNAGAAGAAGTATDGEYIRLDFGQLGVATWKMVATTPGSYSVFFQIPDNIADSTGVVETRNTNVTYLINVTGSNPQTGSATVSQTEANSPEFLAGPFLLQAGDVVTVTLERTATLNNLTDANGNKGQYDLIADSMSLQASFGDVQSTPTAINASAYPNEFKKAVYWGIKPNVAPAPGEVATVSTTGILATDLVTNAAPDTVDGTPTGTAILKYGDPTKAVDETGTLDPTRIIRQLVYFGRSEPIFANQFTADDSSGAAVFTPGQFTTPAAPAASATNNEYKTAPAQQVAVGGACTWTLTAPSGGSYSVSVNIPLPPSPTEQRGLSEYTVAVNGTPVGGIYRVNQITQTGTVTLPTGSLALAAGDTVTVTLSRQTGQPTTAAEVVVADSATITTGNTKGAIYCVDGFTGGVVWRYEIPGSANGPSTPVFSSPAVARINVMVTPPVYTGGVITTPAVYNNKLVVIVGDNNGLVYCLDAIGNGDGTSNANVINQTNDQPIFAPQPAYGTGFVFGGAATPPSQTNKHVGTTGSYWIYRPDANQPKNIATKLPRVDSRGNPILVPSSDLPVPAAFGTASPTVFVDPTVPTATPTASNALVYVGNSNGVLYALDAGGVGIDGATHSTHPNPGSNTPVYSLGTFESTGDSFNVSQDLGGAAPGLVIPTCQPKWWFTLRGPSPNSAANTSAADIESAPALYIDTTTTLGKYLPRVYIGSAHEEESTSNIGRLYALDGLFGPSGNNGKSDPALQPNPATANYTGPGSANYNVGQKPQTNAADTTDWTFPDALDTVSTPAASNPTFGFTHQSSNGKPRPALGNITGSPVVFTNIRETANLGARQTRVYFAANVGIEVPNGSTTGAADVRPDETQTGRVWAVNLDGSVGTTVNSGAAAANGSNVWSYPRAWDPNNATFDASVGTGNAGTANNEPYAPIGSFLHATPAIGFVQFPTQIDAGTGTYTPTDVLEFGPIGIKGKVIPMLYVGTRGVNDTALYAVDIDGNMTGAANGDTQTIYRQISPDGSLFRSSPVLIANATSTVPTAPAAGPGNGGSVLITAGNTLYDFSATPISNPPSSAQNYPLIREDRAYTGFGPISGPALAATDVTDLQGFNLGLKIAGTLGTASQNVSDWVYVGDSNTGFCRGITPNDVTDGNIASQYGTLVPPDVNAPGDVSQTNKLGAYLIADNLSNNTDTRNKHTVGSNAPLPVYEWGQNVYIRLQNVVPPNPTNDPTKYVHDNSTDPTTASATNPVILYLSGSAITVTLSDADGTTDSNGNGTGSTKGDTIPPVQARVYTTLSKPLANGFYQRADPVHIAANPIITDDNLVDAGGKGWIGATTYAIGDGTGRHNTPGGRRQIRAVQTVTYIILTTALAAGSPAPAGATKTTELRSDASNGNETSVLNPGPPPHYNTGAGSFAVEAPLDQPTFGILNPLGIRAGGIPLLPSAVGQPLPIAAVKIGHELGPFRPVSTTTGGIDDGTISSATNSASPGTPGASSLEALANGNDIYQDHAPPSTAGLGDPTNLAAAQAQLPQTLPYTVVTSTPLIAHNHAGDNSDLTNVTAMPMGRASAPALDGLIGPDLNFGYLGAPYSANIFDRTPLGLSINGSRSISVKMDTPPSDGTSGKGGLYWNDNNKGGAINGHNAVVNYLPWESAPSGYGLGINSSPDYPDISPQSITMTLHSSDATDLQASSGTLRPATGGSAADRIVNASALQIHVVVPNHQSANQQVYVGNSTGYSTSGELPPLKANGTTNLFPSATAPTFPMGYITYRRIYIPTRNNGRQGYQDGATYRIISVYTGVPVDMSTSITNPTTDIGKVPAAFGLQTEQYPLLNPNALEPYFTPNNPAFQDYFKPLEIHNDGNVNLLNVHLNQLFGSGTLLMHSDAVDPLSAISGYDLRAPGSAYGVTGPRSGTFGTANVPEEPYLIRSSLDTDLIRTYARNPNLPLIEYPGATFHKPLPGSDAPSILTVPDSPESQVAGYSLNTSPTGFPTLTPDPNNGNLPYKSAPYVSIAMPFGTPVGTYSTSAPQEITSLRLFEGLDTAATYGYNANVPINSLYPPQYGKEIGGIGNPVVSTITGEPLDSNGLPEDTYTGAQPLSTTGTQLTATVVEQRLTDGVTFGDVPMIDAGPGGLNNANAAINAPDFGPAAFRDPTTGSLSAYWTSGRNAAGYNLFGVNLPFTPDPTNNAPGQGFFLPSNPPALGTPTVSWWTSIGGYTAAKALQPVPNLVTPGTNSGLTVALDSTGTNKVTAFAVNVDPTNGYNNTLYSYDVTPGSGALSNSLAITNDPSQVKYGVKGLSTGTKFTDNLWAFWTASTRGRTAIYYNSQNNGTWLPTPQTIGLLPIPAGLTSVADPSPLLLTAPVVNANGTVTSQPVIEVTYSGTGPDGNVDLYSSRYVPDATTASKLNLVAYPSVQEILTQGTKSGWYQARDVAWSRTGALNVFVKDSAATATSPLLRTNLLYDNANKPLFTRAIFDKASGLLVLTGINGTQTDSLGNLVFNNVPANGKITVYIDAATGRVRFTGGTPARQVTALFDPLAKRLTTDARADTAPVTFLDDAFKPNDTAGLQNVNASRLWTIWRKSGVGGDTSSATLYYKTQRLTAYLPTSVGVIQSITLNGVPYTGVYDLQNIPAVYNGPTLVNPASARIYFPIASGAEGQSYSISYTDTAGNGQTWPTGTNTDNVQWQDELRTNDQAVPLQNSTEGLNAINEGYRVPIDTAVNENNVAAFLDTDALLNTTATLPADFKAHKVWLFWNSTRNGTADIYSATINPLF